MQRRGAEAQTTRKGNSQRSQVGPQPEESESVALAFSSFMPALAQPLIYLGGITGHGYSEEVHGHCHACHHHQQQAMARVPMGGQTCLWRQPSNIRP